MTESAWRSGRRQIRCAARTRCRIRRCGPLSSPTRNRLAVLTLLLAVLTGCGPGQLPQGPLGSQPENHDTVGQPVLRGGADTIGFDGFYNGGTKPAVIDRLVIVSPRHIKLTGAYITLGGPIGNWPTFPPSFPT